MEKSFIFSSSNDSSINILNKSFSTSGFTSLDNMKLSKFVPIKLTIILIKSFSNFKQLISRCFIFLITKLIGGLNKKSYLYFLFKTLFLD